MALGYEDWSKAVLGRSRRVSRQDWNAVLPHRQVDEHELGASKGWVLGASVGDPSVDQPCIVFLTDRAVYVEVRPQTLLPRPESIAAPFSAIGRCGIAGNDAGGTRLVFVYDTEGSQSVDDLRSVGVDLPRGRRGATFGQLVVDTVNANNASDTR